MLSAPEQVSYWIQRADFTSADFGPVSLNEALAVLREHDWDAELSHKLALESSGKENCPPGIGFVTQSRHQLHICPRRDGIAECYFLELDSKSSGWFQEKVVRAEQDRLLELLFRGDYASLVQGFNPPVDVWYRIQRADSTYAPDSGPITLAKAQALLRDYDWTPELNYQNELDEAGKDWCPPTIGLTAVTGASLQIQPGVFSETVNCYFWNEGKQRSWGCGGHSSDEQDRVLELFYRGDYVSLTRDWYEYEVETYTDEHGRQLTRAKPDDSDGWLRATWLAKVKQARARRGQPPELTEEERNLSEKGALDLHLREARLEEEKRYRQGEIKAARIGRNWGLMVAAGAAVIALAYYSGILDGFLSGDSRREKWGLWLTITAAALVTSGILHLDLRALLLGTERARKQAEFAKVIFGTLWFLASAVVVALVLTFFLAVLEPWLRPWLSLGLASSLPTLSDRQPDRFLVASGVMLAIIGLTIGSVFVWRRASKPTETRLESITAAGGICLGSFAVLAFGPFLLMFVVFAASMSLMAFGYTEAGTWLNNKFPLATTLMVPVTGILTAIAYLYGRWRAPQWEDRIGTLIRAGGRVTYLYIFGSIGAMLLVTVIAALKANAILG